MVGAIALVSFPLIDNHPYHLDLGLEIGINAIAAMGLNLLLGNAGQISLGQAAFVGIGAYSSAILNVKCGVDFFVAMPAAGVLSAIFGFLLGITALRLRGHHLALITLGFGLIFSIIISQWESFTGGTGGFRGMEQPAFGSFVFDTEMKYFYLVWGILILLLLFGRNITSMRIGRALSAVRQNETLASAIGVNPTKYKLKIFAIAGFYAGVSGSLFSHYALAIGPSSFGLRFSIVLLCMVVVGGLRTGVWGGIIGSAVIYLLPELLSYGYTLFSGSSGVATFDYSWNLIGYGTVMVIFVIFFPEGIAGLPYKYLGRLYGKPAVRAAQ
jgi:branched-chain amino acid transport system permease protein